MRKGVNDAPTNCIVLNVHWYNFKFSLVYNGRKVG